MKSVAGAIFVGGASRRMGKSKALLMWQGQRFIDHQIAYLSAAGCDPIYCVAQNKIEETWPKSVIWIEDNLPNYPGPLVALASVLTACQTSYLMTVPCDAMELPNNLLQEFLTQIASYDTVYLKGQDSHYLIALHNITQTFALNKAVASGLRSMQAWYAKIKSHPLIHDSANESYWNINTREDYERLQNSRRF